ncbi:MAG: heparinase II/III family protein, partial [Verrucomicrobia bacterium]|nr:heparinase II/III family protein [Verrucomicrobiota bacterium]
MLRILLSLFFVTSAFAGIISAPEHPLATLRRDHPRLIASEDDFQHVRELVASDALAGKLYESLKHHADEILGQPTVEHKLIGPRMLDQSRRCLDRVYTLALVYRISGESKYLDRAVTELRAAAGFPDWNPSHFLDVAEMTHAFAIGYDWLFQKLKPDDRARFRKAIQDKALDEAIKMYQDHHWWTVAVHNWNQVCNGGITLGALAIADEDPERAEYILQQSVASIQLAMASYAPEGGWAEGPAYWQYATSYNAYYLAALQSALGTDFGLSSMPGFDHAGDFRIFIQGPAGTFNYGDAQPGAGTAPEMFWLAKRFSQPVFAWDELQHLNRGQRPTALDLVWYQPIGQSPSKAGWPLNKMFRGVNVGFLRSDWDSPDAIWVGVKGGDNRANHSHLDLGSFVLDLHGVRWAVDLGSDDYDLPGYFGPQRFTYYRLRTESHNTVLIDGENQDANAKAPMTMKNGVVAIDLAAAYPGKVTKFIRTIELTAQNGVSIRDEIAGPQPMDLLWGMVTDAQVIVDHRRAQLKKGTATLQAEIKSPPEAVFDVLPT